MTWQRGGLVALLLHRLEDILILIHWETCGALAIGCRCGLQPCAVVHPGWTGWPPFQDYCAGTQLGVVPVRSRQKEVDCLWPAQFCVRLSVVTIVDGLQT